MLQPPTVVRLTAALVLAVLALGLAGIQRVPHPGFILRGDTVMRIEPGSAAETAGLVPGDRIQEPESTRDGVLAARPGETVTLWIRRNGSDVPVPLLVQPPHAAEQVRRLLQTLTGFAFCALGLTVLRRRSDRVGLLFAAFTLSMAVPLHAPILVRAPWMITLVTLLEDWAQVAFGPLLLHFFFRFPSRGTGLGRARASVLYAPAVALGIGAGLHAAGILSREVSETLPPLAGLYVTACLLGAVIRFVYAYATTRRPTDRVRLRAMVLGTLVALVPIVAGLALAGRGGTGTLSLETWSPLLLLALPLSYAYAIVRYQVLDLEVIVRSELVALVGTLGAGILLVAGLLRVESRWRLSERSPWLLAIAGALVATAVVLLHLRLRAVLRRAIGGAGERDRRVRAYEGSLSALLSEDRVLGSLLDNVSSLFGAEQAAVYRIGDSGDRMVLWKAIGEAAPVVFVHETLRDTVRALRRVVDPEQLAAAAPAEAAPRIVDRLDELGFAVFVPLHQGDTLEGVLALGPPAGRPSYARRERRALTRIAVRAAAALHTARAHGDAVQQERIARDLEVARGIQERLLPGQPPLRIGLEISALTRSCEAVGGDFYDFVDFRDGRVGITVGDVSGKGIGASLLMATVHAAFRSEAVETATPGAVLRRLNLLLLDRKEVSKFVCLFYGVLSADGRTLTYANAGIEPPILVRADGSWAALTEGGLLLGIRAETVYEDHRVALAPGDRLVLFSDGLLEVCAPADLEPEPDGTPAGYLELVDAIREGGGGPTKTLRRVLRAAGLSHEGSPPDDVTLVLVRTWS